MQQEEDLRLFQSKYAHMADHIQKEKLQSESLRLQLRVIFKFRK